MLGRGPEGAEGTVGVSTLMLGRARPSWLVIVGGAVLLLGRGPEGPEGTEGAEGPVGVSTLMLGRARPRCFGPA